MYLTNLPHETRRNTPINPELYAHRALHGPANFYKRFLVHLVVAHLLILYTYHITELYPLLKDKSLHLNSKHSKQVFQTHLPEMQHIDPASLDTLESRIAYAKAFVGFTPEDAQAIYASKPVVAALVPAVVDAVYKKLLSFDITAKSFVPRQTGYEGEAPTAVEDLSLEHPQIKFRMGFLKGYLVKLVSMDYDQASTWVGFFFFLSFFSCPPCCNCGLKLTEDIGIPRQSSSYAHRSSRIRPPRKETRFACGIHPYGPPTRYTSLLPSISTTIHTISNPQLLLNSLRN